MLKRSSNVLEQFVYYFMSAFDAVFTGKQKLAEQDHN